MHLFSSAFFWARAKPSLQETFAPNPAWDLLLFVPEPEGKQGQSIPPPGRAHRGAGHTESPGTSAIPLPSTGGPREPARRAALPPIPFSFQNKK